MGLLEETSHAAYACEKMAVKGTEKMPEKLKFWEWFPGPVAPLSRRFGKLAGWQQFEPLDKWRDQYCDVLDKPFSMLSSNSSINMLLMFCGKAFPATPGPSHGPRGLKVNALMPSELKVALWPRGPRSLSSGSSGVRLFCD